jgi:hypothetical protein
VGEKSAYHVGDGFGERPEAKWASSKILLIAMSSICAVTEKHEMPVDEKVRTWG